MHQKHATSWPERPQANASDVESKLHDGKFELLSFAFNLQPAKFHYILLTCRTNALAPVGVRSGHSVMSDSVKFEEILTHYERAFMPLDTHGHWSKSTWSVYYSPVYLLLVEIKTLPDVYHPNIYANDQNKNVWVIQVWAQLCCSVSYTEQR